MSPQHQPTTVGSESRPKSRLRLKMILCLGLVLLVSWALYLVAFKTHVSEDQIGDANKQYDLNMSPSSSDIIQVQNFPAKDIPKTGKYRDSSRLIIVGDVHGMLNELTALLDKVQFDKNSDHLILAGDLTSKGPDSPGVVDLAMSLGATAVRGNHEDHILAAHAAMSAKTKLSNNLEENMSGKNARYHALAKRLGNKRIQWLKKCPIILRVGKLGDMGEVVVVHAGLEPGVKLEEQDSYMAMNMRTISVDGVPSDKHMGVGWIKDWNKYQKSLPEGQRTTVIYGHDSKRGLRMEQYSMGIDTGCVKGGRLTAMVIEGGHTKYKFKLVQVDCPDGRSR